MREGKNSSSGCAAFSTKNVIFFALILVFVSQFRLVYESVQSHFNLRLFYSKRRPLFTVEKFWSVKHPKYLVCRVHNACFGRDGAVLLYQDAAKYMHGCSIGKRGVFTSPEEYQTSDKTAHSHLLRTRSARQHIPHFLFDILPVIMSSEMVWPSKIYESRRTACDSPVDNGTACGQLKTHFKRPLSRRFGADVLLAYNAEKHVNVSDWIATFTKLLPGRPRLLSRRALFNNSKQKSVCFSSIILHPYMRLERTSKDWFSESNRLYSNNRLLRSPPKMSDIVKTVQNNGDPIETCSIQAVIADRNFTSRRHILNVQDVQSVLSNIRSTKSGLNVTVNVTVVYFENKSFAGQISAMQTADVIVGAHGAGLSNIIFARMRTPLIEIFPQFYYVSVFEKLSVILNMTYSSVVAEPDTVSFAECVENYFEMGRVNASFHLNAKKIWNERIKIITAKRNERPALPVLPMPGGYYLRQCARNQQLVVNISDMKEHVSNAIEKVCHRKEDIK